MPQAVLTGDHGDLGHGIDGPGARRADGARDDRGHQAAAQVVGDRGAPDYVTAAEYVMEGGFTRGACQGA